MRTSETPRQKVLLPLLQLLIPLKDIASLTTQRKQFLSIANLPTSVRDIFVIIPYAHFPLPSSSFSFPIHSVFSKPSLLFKYPKYLSFCFFMKISNHWSHPNWLICSVQKVEDKILTVSHQDHISLIVILIYLTLAFSVSKPLCSWWPKFQELKHRPQQHQLLFPSYFHLYFFARHL